MAGATMRGVVRGGMIVLDTAAKLREGTEVLVTPVPDPALGTPAAILAAVEASPQVPAAWVDELEDLIAAGRRPATRDDPFHEELPGDRKSP